MLRLVKSSLDVLLCSLQVSSFLHDRLETVVGQLEGTDWGKTYVVCISVILYHKRLMIQNGTCSEPLHDKLFMGYSLVVRYWELDDARLDEDETINLWLRLEDLFTFIVPPAIHTEEKLLFGNHRERLEVLDLITLYLQKCPQIILVFKHVLLEAALEGCFSGAETFFKFFVTWFIKSGQWAIVNRLNTGSPLWIKDQANLTKMITIVKQLLTRWTACLGFTIKAQTRLDRNFKFTGTDEVHEAFIALSIIFFFNRYIYIRVFILHYYHVIRWRELILELIDKDCY